MKGTIAGAVMLATLATSVPLQPAAAQDPFAGALFGGAAGAIIGGAATGRTGGAIAGGIIGAAIGASVAGSMAPAPRQGYYWYQDGCWLRRGDGSYVRVRPRYCD